MVAARSPSLSGVPSPNHISEVAQSPRAILFSALDAHLALLDTPHRVSALSMHESDVGEQGLDDLQAWADAHPESVYIFTGGDRSVTVISRRHDASVGCWWSTLAMAAVQL